MSFLFFNTSLSTDPFFNSSTNETFASFSRSADESRRAAEQMFATSRARADKMMAKMFHRDVSASFFTHPTARFTPVSIPASVPASAPRTTVATPTRVVPTTPPVKKESDEKKLERYTNQHNQECNICLDTFTKDDFLAKKIHKTACNHFYHLSCIKNACDVKPECPSCRTPIKLEEEKTEWQKYLTTIDDKVKEHTFTKDKLDTAEYEREDPEMLEARKVGEEIERATEESEQIEADEKIAQIEQDHQLALFLSERSE